MRRYLDKCIQGICEDTTGDMDAFFICARDHNTEVAIKFTGARSRSTQPCAATTTQKHTHLQAKHQRKKNLNVRTTTTI